MKTKKFKVMSVSQLDLMISYESVDGTTRCDDDFETKEAWERQMDFILEEAENQGTDDPVIELEFEDYYA
ncbi:hypothetical protein ACFSJM_08750 [Lactococcus formosensis subsp. bovis]|uniref:hypothetical protein n=1 Tax=Lactococcus formosensis TaxID=1281486 RepID=UPI001BD051DB|nr:hypothetical protein [Lactococcus formosensis]